MNSLPVCREQEKHKQQRDYSKNGKIWPPPASTDNKACARNRDNWSKVRKWSYLGGYCHFMWKVIIFSVSDHFLGLKYGFFLLFSHHLKIYSYESPKMLTLEKRKVRTFEIEYWKNMDTVYQLSICSKKMNVQNLISAKTRCRLLGYVHGKFEQLWFLVFIWNELAN